MDENETAYFLTVARCNKGPRGIFCNNIGASFHKEDQPHTEQESQDILGPFAIILAPKSELFTKQEVAQFTYFHPLAEYTYQFGIALKEDDVPIKAIGILKN